jgi:hypothetical protein
MNTIIRAKQYLDWGFVPIPIRPLSSYDSDYPLERRKAPYGVGWDKTTKENAMSKITSAIKRTNEALNVGVLCGKASGIVVLDIDVKKDGLEDWLSITKDMPKIDTFTVRTGGGGLHLYFKYYPLSTTRGIKYKGKKLSIDVRSDAGQVLGPGSIHPSTQKIYEIIGGFEKDKPVLSDFPQWLLTVFDFGV